MTDPAKPHLAVGHHQSDRCILEITCHGHSWEIDVGVGLDADGGIDVTISRDGIVCTLAEFGWDERHENE